MAKKVLTLRQAQWAQKVASGVSPKQAAREVGYASPRRAVFELQGNPEIRRYVGEVLAGRGITMDTLAQSIEEGLKATVTETHLDKGGPDRPAKILYSEPMADYQTRHRYLDTALDLMGAKGIKEDRKPDSAGAYNVYVLAQHFSHLTDEQLAVMMSEAQAGDINLAKYGVSLPLPEAGGTE